ncbi:amidohydrolase family protein [Pseudorhodobacter turbinis]|uniref:amidohydrolase family protein n=1 Tax=Pseudorhodobacter turbinis TaxID=2500533 RepID=UPI00143CC7EC
MYIAHHRVAFELVCDLCNSGRGWVKLSGEYLRGVPGGQADKGFRDTALQLVEMFPERIVWGSDWPQATEAVRPPAISMLNPLEAVAKTQSLKRQILWDNAVKFYGF